MIPMHKKMMKYVFKMVRANLCYNILLFTISLHSRLCMVHKSNQLICFTNISFVQI